MRGIETGKVRIRHEVFTEIARMAYEGGDYAKRLEELPFKIIPGEIGSSRDSLFLERAVVGERLRLAMGLPLRKFSEFSLFSEGVEEALDPEIYYEKPLINVIKFACNRCPDNVVKITNVCQGCLEHPCMSVCPRQAITRQNGQAHIDPDKCIRCGRCLKECKFNAIVRLERPCRKACGMDCIHSDGLGRADIDYSKCTSCGQCMVSCPFGAISDKSQIFQVIQAFNRDEEVIACVAPAFVGQFGKAESDASAESEINSKLSNMVTTGDESVSFNTVSDRLQKARLSLISKSGRAGECDKNKKRLALLNDELEKAEHVYERHAEYRKNADRIKATLEKETERAAYLKAKIDAEQDIRSAAKLKEMLETKEELEKAKEELRLADGGVIDDLYVGKVKMCLAKLETAAERLKDKTAEVQRLKDSTETAEDKGGREKAESLEREIDGLNNKKAEIENNISENKKSAESLKAGLT